MVCIANWSSHFQDQVLTQIREVGLKVNSGSLWWTVEESKSEDFDRIPVQVWIYVAEEIKWLLL